MGSKIKDLPKIKSGEGKNMLKQGSKLIFNHQSFVHGAELLKKLKYVKPNGGLMDVPRRLLNNHLRNMVDYSKVFKDKVMHTSIFL